MKIIACSALVLDTVFMALVGVHPVGDESNFSKNYPWLHKNLGVIGLRT